MDKIYYTLEFDDNAANEHANDLLSQGWTLLHVGSKFIDKMPNGQAYYNTAYVVGATKEQYEAYQLTRAKSQEDLL